MSDIKTKSWIKNYINLVLEEIKDVPKETRDSVQFRVQMSMKHKTFSEKFPSLLMMVVEQGENFDHERLEGMLNLLTSVQSGEKNVDDVDKQLGQEYFDKYVSPHIDKK